MTSGGGSFDIFSRIKNLLSNYGLASKDNSLKRRAPDQVDHPSLTKYRRVTNVFPDVIRRPLEDEQGFLHPRIVNSSFIMSDRKSSQNSRLNLTNPILSRSNLHAYADIEYSDDEDDVVFSNPRHRTIINSTGGSTTALNNFAGKNQLNAILPDHIPVIVRNSKASTSLNSSSTTKRPSNTTINGNISNIPALARAFNYNRDSSASKSDSRDTWHNRLMGKPSRESLKAIPPLIVAKTGRLVPESIPVDFAGNFGSTRTYVNGIDQPKQTKMALTNGFAESSFTKAPTTSQAQASISSQKKVTNSATDKSLNIKDHYTYLNLLKRIVPTLYRSKDHESDRQRLVQLAEARSATTKKPKVLASINLTDDENDETHPKEFIDLSDDDLQMISACRKVQPASNQERTNELPVVEPINSLKDKLDSRPTLQANWLQKLSNTYNERFEQNKQHIVEAEEDARKLANDTKKQEKLLVEQLRKCIVHQETIVLDEEEEEEEEEFPEFTDDQRSLIKRAIYGAPDETLISKFNIHITRRDIATLLPDTWLNDEVINFYMNLLMDRGEQRSDSGLPRVYAMNTFFVPRLLQSGHGGVRRWTRKVDIFSYDVIPVPVHVGQVHWCMAIIHLRNRTIKYYDSMGTPNPRLLNALEEYLKEESLDKRKESFDTSKFVKESVADAPRQRNGSDCGVFSCMFAEYITRNREITFDQPHMPYFRQKMILEIVQGKLLL